MFQDVFSLKVNHKCRELVNYIVHFIFRLYAVYIFQDKFSTPGNTDKVTVLQGQVKEVQGVMSQNIEAVIQRGERLDDLMDKTDELEAAVSKGDFNCHTVVTSKNHYLCL